MYNVLYYNIKYTSHIIGRFPGRCLQQSFFNERFLFWGQFVWIHDVECDDKVSTDILVLGRGYPFAGHALLIARPKLRIRVSADICPVVKRCEWSRIEQSRVGLSMEG